MYNWFPDSGIELGPQSCPTLCYPMDYRVHGILQAKILEWVAFPISRGSSQPNDWVTFTHTHNIYIYICVYIYIYTHTQTHTHIYNLLLFSCSVVSDFLWPHKLQHARLPCPLLSPGACSNSCPLSHWCHPTISSSLRPLSSCPQSFPASGSFLMSWLFASSGQSIGASASASVLLMNTQSWFPLELTGLISLQPKELSRIFSNTTAQKHQFFGAQLSL